MKKKKFHNKDLLKIIIKIKPQIQIVIVLKKSSAQRIFTLNVITAPSAYKIPL